MLLLDSETKNLTPWLNAFQEHLPDEVGVWDQLEDPSKVEMAVVWGHRKDLFRHLPNLKVVASLGAGVDHIVNDALLLDHVQVSKVVSDHLSGPMSNFCIGAVMYFHRQFDKYLSDKKNKVWDQQFDPEVPVRIGILGLGRLGSDLAKKLNLLGFEVHGLSRNKREMEGISTYIYEQMNAFLGNINMLICMLPATPDTKEVLSKNLFDQMPDGSFLINVGRGHQQNDSDILAALDAGKLAGAFLDVFPIEPPPKESPMWDHPKVFITPHIAVVTKLEAAVPQIVDNYRRMKTGQPLLNLIDREKGY